MKFTVKLANGATLDFEGDAEEFERVSKFLADPPESFTTSGTEADGAEGDLGSEDERNVHAALDPATVAAAFDRIGVRNDQERVTIIAHLAEETGKEGVDFPTLVGLYRELGLQTPAQFPSKTLSNAKTAGLVTPVKPGVWRTTYRGSNFARGFGRGNDRPVRRGQRPTPSDHNSGGGDSD